MASSALAATLLVLACSSSHPARDAAPTKVRSSTPDVARPPPACRAAGPAVRMTETRTRSLGPAVAWVGSQAVVAWIEDDGDSAHVVTAHLGADGAGAASSVGGVAALPPVALAVDGTRTVVVWGDDRDRTEEVYARFLNAHGAPEGGETRLSNAAERDPSRSQRLGLDLVTGGAQSPAAIGPGGLVAIWTMPAPPQSQVFARPLGPQSTPVGESTPAGQSTLVGESTPVRISRGASDAWGPAIARAGRRVAMAWCSGVPGRYEVFVATSRGLAETPAATRVAETAWGPCAPSLTAVDDGFVIAWVGGDEREGKVYVTGVDSEGRPGAPHELGPIALRAPGSPIDRLVTATTVPAGAVVAWAGPRDDGSGRMEAALVGPSGGVLAPATVVGDAARHPADPAATSAGEDAFVVWHDTPEGADAEEIFALRVICR